MELEAPGFLPRCAVFKSAYWLNNSSSYSKIQFHRDAFFRSSGIRISPSKAKIGAARFEMFTASAGFE